MNRGAPSARERRSSVIRRRREIDDAEKRYRPLLASIRVLFVAGNRGFRDTVAYFTHLLGYTAHTADSVTSALTVLRRVPVDIMVVEEEPDVPVLVTTLATLGHVDVLVIPIAVVITQEDAARWRERGAFSCIPKPFDLGTYRTALLDAATEVCARRVAHAP